MPVNASPLGLKMQRVLSSGLPAVGNLLFAYVAGSVATKVNTYTDYTGNVANTNPIVLDSLGQIPLQVWLQSGVGYKFVFAPANDTDPPSSPIWTVDSVYGVNDVTVSQSEWVSGPAPTYVSATQFTLVGDQTSTFQVGRRVKTTNTSGTIYSTITVSAFAAVTTVTVVNDSGVLDSGLSAVSYGLLAVTNPAIPRYAGIFTTLNASGAITPAQVAGIVGTTTNNSAQAGSVGEYIESTLASGAAVALATGTVANVISVNLTAGDWDVSGVVNFDPNVATNITYLEGGMSAVSATEGADNTFARTSYGTAGIAGVVSPRLITPTVRYLLAAPQTIYLIARAAFTVNTLTAYGTIMARRRR